MELFGVVFFLVFYYYFGSYVLRGLAQNGFFWFTLCCIVLGVYLEIQREKKIKAAQKNEII